MTLTERNLVLSELRKWKDSCEWMKNVPDLENEWKDRRVQINRTIVIMECVEIRGPGLPASAGGDPETAKI